MTLVFWISLLTLQFFNPSLIALLNFSYPTGTRFSKLPSLRSSPDLLTRGIHLPWLSWLIHILKQECKEIVVFIFFLHGFLLKTLCLYTREIELQSNKSWHQQHVVMIHCVQNNTVFRIHKEIEQFQRKMRINPFTHFKYWSMLLRKKANNNITSVLIEYYVIK